MPSPSKFRQRLLEADPEAIVQEFILSGEAEYVTEEEREHIASMISSTYSVDAEEISVWIVGSAKLGFSVSEKRLKDGRLLPRYRLFGPDSDIDVAVISPSIFDQIWEELSRYAHRTIRLPWDSGRLGDYLVHGWLRPDHFPRRSLLRKCDDWWECFRRISKNPRFGRRKVSGGLFYSMEHLQQYHLRSVSECIKAEELSA